MQQPITVLSAVAASSTNTYYSSPWSGNVASFGSHVITSGTLTGTWTLWATDKPDASLADDTDWVDVSAHADFVETNPAGAATKWVFSSSLLQHRLLRLKYVNASGTGNLTAYITLVA